MDADQSSFAFWLSRVVDGNERSNFCKKGCLLATSQQATDDGNAAKPSLALALALLAAERIADAAETEAAQQLLNTQPTEQAVYQPAEAEGAEQLADEAEHTAEQ